MLYQSKKYCIQIIIIFLQKIRTLDNRISDMKKTLQKELQSTKSDLSSAEEQDISRK